MDNQLFLLVELEDLTSIFSPLKTTSRIKYTCFNVSTNYIIFGATSGGLYVFRREPCCFLQILPNKEGSVTQVAFSPDEKLIAFSTVKGIVCILEKSSHGAKSLISTMEHQSKQVTCLQWNDRSNELFIGDNSGKVSILTVSIFPTKSMFQNPSFVLMQLESKIVQMDFSSNMLLVSTLNKCYICDTSKEIFRQVGHKLREGEYGACIFNTQTNNEILSNSNNSDGEKNVEYPNLNHLKLLCARPGSRIWEVAIDGTVISTHHFKEALKVPPKKIYFLSNSISQNNDGRVHFINNGTCEQINSNTVEQSFNFQKLLTIFPKFFLTYKTDGIYIFDPIKNTVVLWNNEINNIVEVKCVSDVIYVWSGYGKLYALNLLPVEKFIVRLYFQKKYLDLAKLCLEYEGYLITKATNCSKLYVLHDLDEKIRSNELQNRLKPLISICKENMQKRKNVQKLQSGIYLVGNNHLEEREKVYQKPLRPGYLNLKCRSHSVSPERLKNGDSKLQGSSSSLPDLLKEEKLEENLSPTEVVHHERKVKETKVFTPVPALDTESVLKIISTIQKSEPSKESVFNLFEQIFSLFNILDLELAQPLPLKMHFDVEVIDYLSDLFHSTLSSKLLFEFLTKQTCLSESTQKHPNFLTQHISSEILELDYKLSKMIKLFSCVLVETETLELIKSSIPECYYACLNEILNIFNDSTVSNLDLTDVSISTPKLLNRMFFLMSVGQIEQCSKYSSKVNLQDVFYLIFKLQEKQGASGKSSDLVELQCQTIFLSYLDKSTGETKLLSSCSELIEVYVVICLENLISTAGCVREPSCSCGFPYPNLQPSISMFSNVGYALLDKNWPKDVKKCMQICGQVPYLWRYFVFLRRNEPLVDLLPLLLQIGEIQELENRSYEVNETVIETCIKYLIKLKGGCCLNCNTKHEPKPSVSWTTFGTLCIKLLGPKETLALFKKYSNRISSQELYQQFYQSLIFSSIMEKHSKGLRRNVVDLIAGGGGESDRISIFSERVGEEIFGRNCSADFQYQNTKIVSHHWGVMVNFNNNCAVCSLPLETRVLISEAGLVAFKCAHVFHSACLKKVNMECPICKAKNG